MKQFSDKDGGPAFPHCAEVVGRGENTFTTTQITDNGMTLRDYFAAKALGGFLACSEPYFSKDNIQASTPDRYCNLAYEFAESMLKARES